jgi:chromosome segregation ATPase
VPQRISGDARKRYRGGSRSVDRGGSLDEQIAQNEGNRAAVQATIEKLVKSIPMLKERARMRETLSKKGYGSKLDTLSAEQDLVEHQQELQVQQGRLAEAAAGVASLQQQRQQTEAEFRQKSLDELSQDQQKAESLQQQLVQATWRSPVSDAFWIASSSRCRWTATSKPRLVGLPALISSAIRWKSCAT